MPLLFFTLTKAFAPLKIGKNSSLWNNYPSMLVLFDPPAGGAWNMAVDEALLESAADEGRCTLRFYRWNEPTLSLGYFQTYADRWQHAPSSRSAVVRRASGGGAILHDRELTYSFAVPERHPLAADRLGFYRAVHTALIDALAQWRVSATIYTPSTSPEKKEPFLCFERRSPGDVLVGATKIAGSAQRRRRGAVLQHGSVLLAKSLQAPELVGIEELTGQVIPHDALAESWLKQLAEILHVTWEIGQLTGDQERRAHAIKVEKYASSRWTENRSRAENL